MKVCVIGAGYVGLVTGACLAGIGNKVICVDNDKEKIDLLKKGKIPIYEPGLKELVKKTMQKKFLYFTTDIKDGVNNSEIIFIAVNTPPRKNGEADLCYVEAVSREVAQQMKSYKVIVSKSTVPVETGKKIAQTVKIYNKQKVSFDVVSNPEFLREGSAIGDFLHPDRIVIGVNSKKAETIMKKLYKPLGAPIIVTDIESAEIIKHASNSFLAMKISYINAVANICERVGADVIQVARGMGLDRRIGAEFLSAGVGFGGSCFPKDLSAFIRIAEKNGYNFELLKVVKKINREQKNLLIKKLTRAIWNLKDKTIGVLGLAFKSNTDDLRNAPAISIIEMLQKEGARIKVYDPQAMEKAKSILKNVVFCKGPYSAAQDSDALVILTEWDEFKKLDFKKIKKKLKTPVIIDGRNIYNPSLMRKQGFTYEGIGTK